MGELPFLGRREDGERGLGRIVASLCCVRHPIFQDHGDVYDALVVAAAPQEPRLVMIDGLYLHYIFTSWKDGTQPPKVYEQTRGSVEGGV